MYNTIYIFLKTLWPIGTKKLKHFPDKSIFFKIKDLANPAKRTLPGLLHKNILETPDRDCKSV